MKKKNIIGLVTGAAGMTVALLTGIGINSVQKKGRQSKVKKKEIVKSDIEDICEQPEEKEMDGADLSCKFFPWNRIKRLVLNELCTSKKLKELWINCFTYEIGKDYVIIDNQMDFLQEVKIRSLIEETFKQVIKEEVEGVNRVTILSIGEGTQ